MFTKEEVSASLHCRHPPPPPPPLDCSHRFPPLRLLSQIHHLDFTSQIMMLLTCITLFRASRNKLKASISGHHEWSNSVRKNFFLRLFAVKGRIAALRTLKSYKVVRCTVSGVLVLEYVG